MKKFTENNEFDEMKGDIKDNLKEIWGKSLDFVHVSITKYYPTNVANYSIILSIYKKISNKSYDDFNSLFTFLNKLNLKYELNNSSQLIITCTELGEILNELEMITKSKKYNL